MPARRFTVALVTAVLAVTSIPLSGCGGFETSSGVMPEQRDLRRLRPGEARKEDVAALLGGPSVVGTFDDNRWYYVGKRTERFAFLDPKLREQQVVVVEFEDDGMLRRIRTLDQSDARSINPVDRETPTAGAELTFLQQLLGNVGKFNPEQ